MKIMGMLFILGFYSFNAFADWSFGKTENDNVAMVSMSATQGMVSYINQQARTFKILIRIIDELGLNSPVITLTELEKSFLITTNPEILNSLARSTQITEDVYTKESRYVIPSTHRKYLISQISNHFRENSLNYAGARIILAYSFSNPAECLGVSPKSDKEYNLLKQHSALLEKEAKDLKEVLEDRINAPYFKDALFKTFVPFLGLFQSALSLGGVQQAATSAMQNFGRQPGVSAALVKELAEAADSKMLVTALGWPIITLINGVIQYREYHNDRDRNAEMVQFAKDLSLRTEKLYKNFDLTNNCIGGYK